MGFYQWKVTAVIVKAKNEVEQMYLNSYFSFIFFLIYVDTLFYFTSLQKRTDEF